MQNQSEVARFRAQIELEHEAMVWARTGLSEGSLQHAFISRRMGHTDVACRGLSRLVGEDQAMQIVHEVWEKTPEKKQVH